MPEPVKVNVVSYGGVKPGQFVIGNTKAGGRFVFFDAARTTSARYVFALNRGLTAWDVELPALQEADHMFYGSGISEWHVDLPKLVNSKSMFDSASITVFNGRLPKLGSASSMFYACTVEEFVCAELGTLGAGLDGSGMFSGCSRLERFDADLSMLNNGKSMFHNCSLGSTSAARVLETIPDRASAGLAVAELNIGKRGKFKEDPVVKALLGETGAEITAKTYSCKGWNVVVEN